MSKLTLLFASALALIVLPLAASSAHADVAETDPAGNISNISNGLITFGSSPTIQCNVSLNGTLRETVDVTVGEHIGSITEVRVANCRGGSVSSINDLTWPMRTNFILDVDSSAPINLDAIEIHVVDLVGVDFTLSVFGGFVNCRYEGTARAFIELGDTGTNTYSVGDTIADETVDLLRIGGSDLCPDEGGFSGSFDTSPDQTIVTI